MLYNVTHYLISMANLFIFVYYTFLNNMSPWEHTYKMRWKIKREKRDMGNMERERERGGGRDESIVGERDSKEQGENEITS